MRLRIATFNIENLASRHSYGPKERPETAPALSLFDFPQPGDRANVERAIAVALEDDKRQTTALAIAEMQADVLALQEVDNLGVLQPFLANYVHPLSDLRYGHLRLIEGNDQRGIDIALAVRTDLLAGKAALKVQSHRDATFGELGVLSDELRAHGIAAEDRVFNRDCLEATMDLGDRQLTLFLVHLKAIGPGDDGREATRPFRDAEARAVRRIIEQRFGDRWREANWVIAGDMNDFRERVLPGGQVVPALPSGLDPLFDGFGVNPADGLPATERWTYYFREWSEHGGHLIDEHVQLDYVLLSPAIAAASPAPSVTIIRRGLPYLVPLDPSAPDRSIGYLATRGDRYPRVGWSRPKASDHCPIVVEMTIPQSPNPQ